MTCEYLEKTKLAAKGKGLNPKRVFCPPNMVSICTETDCPLLVTRGVVPISTTQEVASGQVRFYRRLSTWAEITGRI